VGRALVSHPGIDMVTFTGGTSSGRAIGAIAAARPYRRCWNWAASRPTLFSRSDAETGAGRRRVRPVPNSGQSCIAGSRIFVHAKFTINSCRAWRAGCRAARGRPVRPEDGGGPGGQLEHRDRIEAYVERARGEGARVLCGGARPTDSALARGAYVMPTILELDDGNCSAAREEIFGPVCLPAALRDETDLIRQANDTIYGLAAGIWTRDYKRALRVGRQIRAGTLWINTFRLISPICPLVDSSPAASAANWEYRA